MRILILGAGNAGRQLALRLCEEKHSVVMVDTDPQALAEAEANLDVLTVCGTVSSPRTLDKAQIDKCDLLIAVTDCDEANILACLYANASDVPRKVARVTSQEYIHADDVYDLNKMGIDLVINQKQECAREISHSLSLPGAVESFDLFAGKMIVAGFRVDEKSQLAGTTPAVCERPELIQQVRMIAIRRNEDLIVPHGDTKFKMGDLVYLAGNRNAIAAFSEWICPQFKIPQKVIIAGGGDLGLMLAKTIEDSFECILLEQDEERADLCSGELRKALVLRADALAESTMEEAGVTDQTAFIALTGDDEKNIMNCLMAKKHGVGFTISQITRTDYVPIITGLNLVDRLISPYISTTHSILHYLRSEKVRAASLLHSLPGELLDIVIFKDTNVDCKMIKDIKMPHSAVIATVLRKDEVLAATGDLRLMADDRLLIFTHHNAVSKIENLFLK